MYFTDDSLFPENMQPTIITAAPFGPEWLPGDVEDLPVSFKDQVQAAVDCYNAGATMLHVHVRDPKTGQGSSNFDQYNEFIGMLRNAVPKMILQVGGSISFAPHTADAKAKWLDYDTRHMLTELNPKPDCVTITTGTTLWDVTQAFIPGDADGTHLADPKVAAAWADMVVDSTSKFYLEHLKRLSANKIQPYFVPGHVHQLEIIERLLRAGVYKGPLNLALCGYGGGSMGRNPFDWMEMLRRTPHGASSVTFWSSMRGNIAIQTPGDDSRRSRARRYRRQHLGHAQEALADGEAGRVGGEAERAIRPQGRQRRRGAQDDEDRRLVRDGGRDALQPRPAAEPAGRLQGVPDLRDRRAAAQGLGRTHEFHQHPVATGAGKDEILFVIKYVSVMSNHSCRHDAPIPAGELRSAPGPGPLGRDAVTVAVTC